MRHDVLHAASCGVHGVVLGMLRADGSIDTDQLRPFVELCSTLGVCVCVCVHLCVRACACSRTRVCCVCVGGAGLWQGGSWAGTGEKAGAGSRQPLWPNAFALFTGSGLGL